MKNLCMYLCSERECFKALRFGRSSSPLERPLRYGKSRSWGVGNDSFIPNRNVTKKLPRFFIIPCCKLNLTLRNPYLLEWSFRFQAMLPYVTAVPTFGGHGGGCPQFAPIDQREGMGSTFEFLGKAGRMSRRG